ncbi:hypothetical protein DLAC_05221 [Tieghemostelium lacteum]|uniref:Terpene synthase n=1 Tax=Tieghemostelium lacteum TaxID=361077 RepID=A0A151ZIK5_TIELA|nr:hypothetical protein DLAC_05221 [Tieghemostelium lacteum]|eukprot:KYQ93822.1 hypothetical protein DLAC_05221 [Tieghemostelium lacteum]
MDDIWDYKLYSNQVYKVPEVYCVYGDKTSLIPDQLPISDQIEKTHLKWLNDWKFYGNIPLNRTIHTVAPYSFSFLPEKYFVPIYKIIDWFIIIDDLVLEKKNFTPEYLDNLFNRESNKHDLYGKSYWEILDEFDSVGVPRETMNNIVKNVLMNVKKTLFENLRESTLEQYLKIRGKTLGSPIFYETFLLDQECTSIPKSILLNPLIKRLTKVIATSNSLVNDLYSFVNEFQYEEYDNYVKILTYQLSKDLKSPYPNDIIQTSMNKIKDIINSSFEEAAEIGEELKRQYSNLDEGKGPILNVILSRIYEASYGHLLSYRNRYRYKTTSDITPLKSKPEM